jgi:toxin ParE1/3/4
VTSYRVRVSEEAEQDLIDIYRYVTIRDSVERAAYVLDQLEPLCSTLAELPMRGNIPPELARIGVTNYREVHFKPYRVIYEVVGQDVFVHCVLDGLRDMQSLLERRLVR